MLEAVKHGQFFVLISEEIKHKISGSCGSEEWKVENSSFDFDLL